MELQIIQAIITALSNVSKINYVGLYPKDYANIHSYVTSCLVKLLDNEVVPAGHMKYDIDTSTSVLLFSTTTLSNILNITLLILASVIKTINQQTNCIVGRAGLVSILTGDINDYSSPSSTGYNGIYTVRKITFRYTIRKIISTI